MRGSFVHPVRPAGLYVLCGATLAFYAFFAVLAMINAATSGLGWITWPFCLAFGAVLMRVGVPVWFLKAGAFRLSGNVLVLAALAAPLVLFPVYGFDDGRVVSVAAQVAKFIAIELVVASLGGGQIFYRKEIKALEAHQG